MSPRGVTAHDGWGILATCCCGLVQARARRCGRFRRESHLRATGRGGRCADAGRARFGDGHRTVASRLAERTGANTAAGDAVPDRAISTPRAGRQAGGATRSPRRGGDQAGPGGARVGAGRRRGRAVGRAWIAGRRAPDGGARNDLRERSARASGRPHRSAPWLGGGPAARAREVAREIQRLSARRLQGRRLRGSSRPLAPGLCRVAALACCGSRTCGSFRRRSRATTVAAPRRTRGSGMPSTRARRARAGRS